MTVKDDNEEIMFHSYLKYKGVYNWKDLFRFMRKWTDKNHYTFHEKLYKEKPFQYGLEIQWKCECEKKVDGLYKYWMMWELRIWDQIPVEVIKDGQKVMMDEGRMRIKFNSLIHMDYEGQFEKRTAFIKKMENFLYEKVMKEETRSIHWDGLYYEMNRFKNEVEAHLKMETSVEGSPYHG